MVANCVKRRVAFFHGALLFFSCKKMNTKERPARDNYADLAKRILDPARNAREWIIYSNN